MSSTSAAASVNLSPMKLPLYVDRDDCYLKISKSSKPTKHTDEDATIFLDEAWEIGWLALRNSKSVEQAKNYINRTVAEYKRQFLKALEGQSGYNATNHGNNNDDHFGEIRKDAYKVFRSTLEHWRNQDTYAEKRPKQAAEQEIEREANRERRATSKAIRNSMSASFAERKEEDKRRHTQNKFNAAIKSGNHINLRSFARSLHLLKENQIGKYHKIVEKQHLEKKAARKTKKNSPKKLSSVKENNKE
jgi:hypothetical protein